MSAQDYVPTTVEELAERIDGAARRFADLVRSLGPDVVVGEWTSADVATHLFTVVNRYVDFDPARLAANPRGVDEINRHELDAMADVPVETLLSKLDGEMARFRERWGPQIGIPLDTPLPFHGGATIDLQSALTNLIGEYLVHGLDLACAATREWSIDARDGALLCAFATQLLPAYIRASNPHVVCIRCDLDGVAPFVIEVVGPDAVVRPPRPRDDPDVALAGVPTGFALLMYARADAADLDRIGLRVAGGRRPELISLWTELIEEP